MKKILLSIVITYKITSLNIILCCIELKIHEFWTTNTLNIDESKAIPSRK